MKLLEKIEKIFGRQKEEEQPHDWRPEHTEHEKQDAYVDQQGDDSFPASDPPANY